MPDSQLCLEALSALSGCNVQSTSGVSQLSPQDFVNIVALKEFYKQEGLKVLDYPSIGTMSLHDPDDIYSSPLAVTEGPSTAGLDENVRTTVKINFQDFFHPQYDYDFTNVKDDGVTFQRGNEPYARPCGWNRVALRVTQKYDGGEGWLGTGKDAWPVSYQGQDMDGSLGIILTRDVCCDDVRRDDGSRDDGSRDDRSSFLEAAAASLVTGETRGRGVYSTPDIKTAEKYCKKFKSKTDGKTYKVVLQNRINPKKRTKCQREDVWLVYVPEGHNDVQTRAIVQESIRPYGLLLLQQE